MFTSYKSDLGVVDRHIGRLSLADEGQSLLVLSNRVLQSISEEKCLGLFLTGGKRVKEAIVSQD